MKAKNPRSSRPVAAGLLAGLLCCLPAGNQHAQILSGAPGDSRSSPGQASAFPGFAMGSTMSLLNTVRVVLRARHKLRRRLRQAHLDSDLPTCCDGVLVAPKGVGVAGGALGFCDHYPLRFKISPRYRTTFFRPKIEMKQSAGRIAAPQI